MCPVEFIARPKGVMDMELYRKIVDECARHRDDLDHFGIFLNGEPLLDRQLAERVRYAKVGGLRDVYFSTNAFQLTEARARELIEAGLDRMYISVDGASKETYEKIRVRLKFERVVENIERLVDLRRRLGSATPRIELQIIEMPENAHEVEAFLRRWQGRVDRVYAKGLHDWAGQSLRPAPRPEGAARIPCLQLWYNLVIFREGEVALCCYDYDGRVILGNVREQTIAEIWRGARYREVRRLHWQGRYDDVPLCKTCHGTYETRDAPAWWR
jgi:MoaA/NifB/PqqE/SkfB family radical SAM enzyme